MKSSLVSASSGHVTFAHIAGIPVVRDPTPAVFISSEAGEPTTRRKAPAQSVPGPHPRSVVFSPGAQSIVPSAP